MLRHVKLRRVILGENLGKCPTFAGSLDSKTWNHVAGMSKVVIVNGAKASKLLIGSLSEIANITASFWKRWEHR